jgi:hypothetical protein
VSGATVFGILLNSCTQPDHPRRTGTGMALERAGYGFWDPGLVQATARTVYDARDEGTESTRLTPASCLYPNASDPLLINPQACARVAVLPPFASGNAWTNADVWPTENFWVVQMNDEGAFDPCNSGMPDVSLPRASPGTGIMGMTLLKLPEEGIFRSHLVLNYSFQSACDQGAPFTRIPFLSFGAHKDRGNAKPIGAINPPDGTPSHVTFTLRLWDISANDTPMASELWTVASWGGRTRMVFVALGRSNLSFAGAHRHWNWPIAESFLSPGADIVYFDADELAQRCPRALTAVAGGVPVPPLLFSSGDRRANLGRDVRYDLDLDALFHCASEDVAFDDPLPPTATTPVDGVFWSNEIAGRGQPSWLWTSVNAMDVY